MDTQLGMPQHLFGVFRLMGTTHQPQSHTHNKCDICEEIPICIDTCGPSRSSCYLHQQLPLLDHSEAPGQSLSEAVSPFGEMLHCEAGQKASLSQCLLSPTLM